MKTTLKRVADRKLFWGAMCAIMRPAHQYSAAEMKVGAIMRQQICESQSQVYRSNGTFRSVETALLA